MKKFAIIVGGGRGSRMQSTIPKQFMELAGKPVLMHTIEVFAGTIPGIEPIIVLSPDQFDRWERLCDRHNFNIKHHLASGGETRFESVLNGLSLINDQVGTVAIHDAVRPLVSRRTIISAFRTAEMYGNAVPALPMNDSIRQLDSGRSIAVDRSRYCIIQTPQCFRLDIIRAAYQQPYRFNFTDDATVVEALGEKIHLIDGNPDNLKITIPKDLLIAEALLSGRIPAFKQV